MGNFKQNNRSGGRGNNRRFDSRDSERSAVMHRAVCSECGADCEVPFKPTGDKPVFCSNCFRNKRGSEPRRSDRRDSRRFDSGDRTMHRAVCDKCGKECEVPFKPSSDKPIYCSQCFSKRGSDNGSSQTNSQFDAINVKLDKILKALNPSVSTEVTEKKKPTKKAEVSKAKNAVKKTSSSKKPKAKKKK